jgi:two-component system copper resistance phosphate regulon response regulator CusR
MRILAIEDEPRMSALLYKGLSEHGHDVSLALTGADGLKLTLDQTFEVILLDVGLPDLSGYDVAEVLRARNCPSPILMLTAYNKEDQIVRGLNLGADDYLTKPFSFPELLARLRAVTRPLPEPAPMVLRVADLFVDLLQRRVTWKGQAIDLTRTEFLLLEALAHNFPYVASRVSLIEGIWGDASEVTPGALDVLVNSLRSKMDARCCTKLVQTVRGIGYQLKATGE